MKYIEGNTLTNWNRDGDGGAGAGGSNGDGIYLPKKELNVVEIHENSIVRDETLPGRTGYAARLAYSGTRNMIFPTTIGERKTFLR